MSDIKGTMGGLCALGAVCKCMYRVDLPLCIKLSVGSLVGLKCLIVSDINDPMVGLVAV